MKDLEALGSELLRGKNGDAIRSLAASKEAQRLGQTISAQAAEQAVRSGDTAKMAELLRQAVSTPEGKALAEKLSSLTGQP